MSGKLSLSIYMFFLSMNLLVTGGRIAASDEMTMYYVTKGIIEHGDVSVPGGNVTPGRNNKLYSRYGIGQSLVAIPLYIMGKATAPIAPAEFKNLLLKASVSLTNSFIGAGVCLIFFLFCIQLGYSRRFSFWLTLGLGIGSFFFPYTKSFLSEPLQALCLLGSIYCAHSHFRTGRKSWLLWAGIFTGFGLLTKITFAINIIPLGLYALLARNKRILRQGPRLLIPFLTPLLFAFAVVLWYNFARFGSIFLTGYGRYATPAGFSTPLYVGLFGLLLSSGKGIFWFTPLGILGLTAFYRFLRKHRDEAFLLASLFLINLLLYAKYKSWAGEGSWGPRYLVPVTPLLILPIGELFRDRVRSIKKWFFCLLALGFLIQFAGISIYFGNYYREIGEYPYKLPFADPLFLHKSRFVPYYSQIVWQWRMLIRNTGKAISGERIKLTPLDEEKRIPLNEDQKRELLNTLDYWFAYARYAGISIYPILAALAVLLAGIVAFYRSIHLQLDMGEP